MSFIPHPHKALKTGIQGHWILAKFQRALVSSLHISVVPVLLQFLVFKECLFWQFTVTFKKLFKKCLSKKMFIKKKMFIHYFLLTSVVSLPV